MNKAVLIVILFLFPFFAIAQSGKKPDITKDSLTLTHKKHSPHLATIYSAILPGLGQAYNKKFWKIPIIYAGLIGAGYLIKYNHGEMKERQDALKLLLDGDSSTIPKSPYNTQPIEITRAERNQFRTNRDYSIIGFAGIYLLNIVDAAVDAHFYNFNIDKPLALQKTRHLYFSSFKVQNVPTVGLAYRF